MDDADKTPNIDDELLLDQEHDPDAPEGDEDDGSGVNDEGEGEETLTFGDDADEQSDDSNLVKHLRSEIKRARQEAAEARKSAPQQEKVEVGPKPTLAGCGYDEDKYESALDAWKDRKAAAERQTNAATEAGEAERQAWEAELQRYSDGKSKLQFADIGDAEETVKASLDPAQQATLIMAADDPARLTYALGRHPAKLAELAAEKNPLKLAAKIAKLEGTLRVVKGRKAIDPDTPERGSGKISRQGSDKKLAQLEKEANETGDRSKLAAYRYEQRKAGK